MRIVFVDLLLALASFLLVTSFSPSLTTTRISSTRHHPFVSTRLYKKPNKQQANQDVAVDVDKSISKQELDGKVGGKEKEEQESPAPAAAATKKEEEVMDEIAVNALDDEQQVEHENNMRLAIQMAQSA